MGSSGMGAEEHSQARLPSLQNRVIFTSSSTYRIGAISSLLLLKPLIPITLCVKTQYLTFGAMDARFRGTGRKPKGETKYMSEFQEYSHASQSGAPRWVGLAVGVLAALSLIGLVVGWSALSQARNVEQTTQASLKQANDGLSQ